jgi:hypothetical protein
MGGSYKVKYLVKRKNYYIGRDDWLHDVVLPNESKITDPSKIPQQLFEITAAVGEGFVSFFDWVAEFNGEKGFGVSIEHEVGATFQMTVDTDFRVVDFKIWFPASKVNYGYSNVFVPELHPKAVIDAFWGGKNEEDITSRVDVVLEGRLDDDMPMGGV